MYKTMIDRYYDNMRPWQKGCLLTASSAKQLPLGSRINVMFNGIHGPIEYELISLQGLQLRNVSTGELLEASSLFERLGDVSPDHVAWRI